MKKALLVFLATVGAFNFAGCKKIIDQINNNPGQDFQYCDIKKFKVWMRDSYNEFTVYYNKNGQPKDVLGTYPDTARQTWSYDQHFRYDNQGRVTDWINNSPGLKNVFQWETFHYLSPTQVLDSIYELNGVNGSYITDQHPPYNAPGAFTLCRIIDYDSYGRAIKITSTLPAYVQNIVYDANGNSNVYDAYDNGINLMRTNKVWMFVNVNYNTNNFTKGFFANAYTYNSYMLPTSIQVTPESHMDTEQFWGVSFVFDRMEIEYDCKGSPKY
jgi:hypothetical protein